MFNFQSDAKSKKECDSHQSVATKKHAFLSTIVLFWQIAFMKELMAEGLNNTTDVVFLDMDAFVVDSIAEVFH